MTTQGPDDTPRDPLFEELVTYRQELVPEEKAEADYAPLGLTWNPFPVAGIATGSELMPPIREHDVEVIKAFITSTFVQTEFGGMTIVGDYGMGKTHLMRYLVDVINRTLGTAEGRPALAVYVENPGLTARDVIHRIVEEIGEERIVKYVWQLIIHSIEESCDDRNTFYAKFGARQAPLPEHDKLTQEHASGTIFAPPCRANYKEFLRLFREMGGNADRLREFAIATIRDTVSEHHAGVAQLYVDLLMPDSRKGDQSWDTLAGLGRTKELENKERIFMRSVINLLRQQRYSHLYVFLDEMEDVAGDRFSKMKRSEYLTTLRILVDREVRHMSLVVSLNEEALNEVRRSVGALADRLARWQIVLTALHMDECQELIKRYVARAASSQRPGDPYFPFTTAAIEALRLVSQGNTRTFLTSCQRLLKTAVERDGNLPLTGQHVQDYLDVEPADAEGSNGRLEEGAQHDL